MADTEESPLSLLKLEDDLTCSICLSPFDSPVTIPCGHNFCHACLLGAWKHSVFNASCPQCRTAFASRPELKKNTVLSSVVEAFTARVVAAPTVAAEESGEENDGVIRCDTCMQTEACQTCLTCMASYCEEHLQPHLDNPVFRLHQLSEPVGDLSERICSDHHKLMEFFCSQHDRPICSFCLQQVHKGCSFVSPEEQRNLKESDLRCKLGVLDGKITKNEEVVAQMKDMESKLRELATNKRKALAAEYQQMRDIMLRAERDALTVVDHELESGQTKLRDLGKRFTENVDSLSKAKEHIHGLLSQSQTLPFLQVSFDLPSATKSNPFIPRIVLDSKQVVATEAFAAALKEYLLKILKQPVEDRLLTLKPDETNIPATGSTGPPQESEQKQIGKQKVKPRSHSPGRPPVQPHLQPHLQPHPQSHPQSLFQPDFQLQFQPDGGQNPFHYPQGMPHIPMNIISLEKRHELLKYFQPTGGSKKKSGTRSKNSNEDKMGKKDHHSSKENLLDLDGKDQPRGDTPTGMPHIPMDITSPEKRHELLKYSTKVSLNPMTAHRRIILTDGFTKASLSDEPRSYPDHPSRFTVCTQVLASRGFTSGRHYWEVRLSGNNFVGIGLCYSSMYRKGPTSRLGRNDQSWCVEWFNGKLSAWHSSSQTVLENCNPKRVGVLLDCEAGTATFYNVKDRAYPFHSFLFSFAEAVYPAFWIFSSDSSIDLPHA